jgi:hypothetical protein
MRSHSETEVTNAKVKRRCFGSSVKLIRYYRFTSTYKRFTEHAEIDAFTNSPTSDSTSMIGYRQHIDDRLVCDEVFWRVANCAWHISSLCQFFSQAGRKKCEMSAKEVQKVCSEISDIRTYETEDGIHWWFWGLEKHDWVVRSRLVTCFILDLWM